MKVCGRCKKELSEDNFYKSKSSKDGLNYMCKTCQKAYDDARRNNSERKIQKQQNQQKYYESNKELLKLKCRQYCSLESTKELRRKYYQNNREELKQYAKDYYASHKLEIQQYNKNRDNRDYDKQRNQYLSRKLSAVAHRCLKRNNVSDNTWQKYFPYTQQTFREHIEKQFTSDMSWSNYGEYWELDHIIPQSVLLFDDFNCINYQICWSLSNLRPLEVSNNRSRPRDGSDISENVKKSIIYLALN